ncbi:MAG: SDR family oxidoreductase [Gaiellales bacterium]
MGRVDGKVVVVTGAAGVLGRAAAVRLAAEGAQVACADIVEVTDAPGPAFRVDVTDPDSVRELYDAVEARFGRIDVLFNNAGIGDRDDRSVLDTPLEVWRRLLDIDLTSVFLCCKYGIPKLLAAGGGVVINTASFVAVMGSADPQIGYTAAKGGVLAISREMAVEFARRDVRVHALCPGPVRSPVLEAMYQVEEEWERRRVHIPIGRLATAEEMAAAVVFLASDESSYITGTAFLVDGGITAAYTTPE